MIKHNNTYIVDYGGNNEVIILLHGFISSSRYWKKLRPLLSADGYRVITIDLLGFGNAPKPITGEYSYEEHVRHINNAVNSLQLKDRFTLIGHSMGALLAIRYSEAYEHKVKSLILLHPPLYKNRAQVRETLRNTGMSYRTLLDSRYRHYLWIILRNVGIVGKHNRYSRENSLLNVIERAEMLNDLQIVRYKTLLFIGSKDRKEYIANLSDYDFNQRVSIIIEKVNHHSPILQPKLVRNYILEFIS